jgi:hypothetical protein
MINPYVVAREAALRFFSGPHPEVLPQADGDICQKEMVSMDFGDQERAWSIDEFSERVLGPSLSILISRMSSGGIVHKPVMQGLDHGNEYSASVTYRGLWFCFFVQADGKGELTVIFGRPKAVE